MTSLSHDDCIEVISTSADDVTLTDNAAHARVPGTRLCTATLRRAGKKEKERQTKEEKRISRVVTLVAGTLIIMSMVLIGVTLSMSDHIDEMGEFFARLCSHDGDEEMRRGCVMSGNILLALSLTDGAGC